MPDEPPFIAIEILSKDDRFSYVRDKLEEYRAWGVKHVWLLDPRAQKMYRFDEALAESAVLNIPEFNAELRPAGAFLHAK